MSIKFGLITNPSLDILEEIRSIGKLGFDYVELGIEIPGGSPGVIIKNKDKILNLLEGFNSPALAHTAWWIDFGSGYDSIRKVWVEEGKRNVGVAKNLNIKKINFHFYSLGLTKTRPYHKVILNNIVKSLKEVVNYANSKNVMAIFENAPTKRSFIGIEEYKFVIDNVPRLKVHLDIAHAFVENGMQGIKDYIFTFKDRIEHIHIHDNHGEEDEHLPLGKGKINFEQVAKWLKQINYNKTITFEVFTSKEDARESMFTFNKLMK